MGETLAIAYNLRGKMAWGYGTGYDIFRLTLKE
ncbi:hypothetical protein RUMTOR_00673 [[Ruminococcus] torques ATCC 27756]|uniref:Uncharacterized protein n=1 Tax=[Ruminococcus] torques ATCC 27756 TaxID=411460 RepID=A5KKC1_9FIRM|nr:hypothetical protein RUMTOR_00673 [[Ruminococcus] torques ATCC 27756]